MSHLYLLKESKITFSEWILIFKAPFALFAIHAVISLPGIDLYHAWPSVDIPMHFFGGASIAMAGKAFLDVLRRREFVSTLPWQIWLFLIIAMVGCAAAAWELLEFAVSEITGLMLQGDHFDTMFDLVNGLSGGVAASLWYMFWKRAQHTNGG